MSDSESNESFIDCEIVGDPVYEDHDSKYRFYVEVLVNDRRIRLGDVVKVHLDGFDEANTINTLSGAFREEYAYCVVLALFEDAENVVMTEVRWLWTKRDLNARLMKLYNAESPVENEFIISDQLDDIPVGSIIEHISIQDYVNPSHREESSECSNSIPSSSFTCRFQVVSGSNSLQPCDFITAYQQGLDLSHYRQAYDLSMYNLPNVASSNINELDLFSLAIKRLHISVIPDRLPCRSKDQATITNFILRGLKKSGDHSYGPLLISGMPGSGKTATVIASIREIQRTMMGKGDIPEFEYVEINCLRIRKADDAYSVLWRAISDESVSGAKALKHLNQYFIPDHFRASNFARTMVVVPVVCLLDEMEYLITKNQTALYNFLEWSRATNNTFILIGVANAMDVVDRVMQGCNASRSAIKTTQMAFSSYTFLDITAILSDRIASLSIPGVDHRTIETCARKAASFTGDIRTALKIFQRALEFLREEDPIAISSDYSRLVALVKRATDAYVNKPHIYMLQQSCYLDQAIMIAVCKHIKATGGNNTFTLEALYDRLDDLLSWAYKVNNSHPSYERIRESRIPMPRVEIFYTAILRLLEEGFLGDALTSNAGKTWYISDDVLAYDGATSSPRLSNDMRFDMMIGSRLEFGDIIGALRDINGLVQYVDA